MFRLVFEVRLSHGIGRDYMVFLSGWVEVQCSYTISKCETPL